MKERNKVIVILYKIDSHFEIIVIGSGYAYGAALVTIGLATFASIGLILIDKIYKQFKQVYNDILSFYKCVYTQLEKEGGYAGGLLEKCFEILE